MERCLKEMDETAIQNAVNVGSRNVEEGKKKRRRERKREKSSSRSSREDDWTMGCMVGCTCTFHVRSSSFQTKIFHSCISGEHMAQGLPRSLRVD